MPQPVLFPFASGKFRNKLIENEESNEASPSTRDIAKLLYEDFTTKRYGNGTQVLHVNVFIGANIIYISLHKIILLTPALIQG